MTSNIIDLNISLPEMDESLWVALAHSYEIDCDEALESCDRDRRRCKAKYRKIDQDKKEILGPIEKGLKKGRDYFNRPLEFLKRAIQIMDEKMIRYQNEVEHKRIQEEAILREQALSEQERLASESLAAKEAGQYDIAQAKAEMAESVPTPVLASIRNFPRGTYTTETYVAECYDEEALLRAVFQDKAPRQLFMLNQKLADSLARAQKKNMRYPGLRAVVKKGIRQRAE